MQWCGGCSLRRPTSPSTSGSTRRPSPSSSVRTRRELASSSATHAVGGRLRIDMVDEDAVVHVTGTYLELDRPRRLHFTWTTDYGDGFDSTVTVTFEPHGPGETLMTIDHAGLPPQWRDDHERGWGLIAAQLAQRLWYRL